MLNFFYKMVYISSWDFFMPYEYLNKKFMCICMNYGNDVNEFLYFKSDQEQYP